MEGDTGPADDRIFVQIAAYREVDLPNTIRSLLTQAAQPDRLRFGICLQYDDVTRHGLQEWSDDARFSVEAVPYGMSRGLGWARARAQALYDGEGYTYQVDAHMRFAPRWDDRLVAMLHAVDSERPIVTNYPLSFFIEEDGTERFRMEEAPHRLELEPSRAPGSLRQRGIAAESATAPQRHPFIAGGNMFTLGRFCHDVPYDPEIYFLSEETCLAVRAYTHGYDSYYPHEHVVWHWYHHPGSLHWDDHADQLDLHHKSIVRIKRLLEGDDSGFGPYGLGRRRTAAGYARLVGLPLPPVGFACAECHEDHRVDQPVSAYANGW